MAENKTKTVKKLLKHGKFFERRDGVVVRHRAGAIVEVPESLAKNNPDQFVDVPGSKGAEEEEPTPATTPTHKPVPAEPIPANPKAQGPVTPVPVSRTEPTSGKAK